MANEVSAFPAQRLAEVRSVMFVAAGGDASQMVPLFDACPNTAWVHSLFAGVDSLAPFIAAFGM